MNGPSTPLADSYLRARLGLPPDFDLDSVPFPHLEFVAEELKRKAEAKAAAERKEAEAEQKRLAALQPPKIIPQFIATAFHLKGDRRISGISSTAAINSHGYAVHPGGCGIILPIPLLLEHDARQILGSIEAAEITAEGQIRVWANVDSRCNAETWRRIENGDLSSFSGAMDSHPGTFDAPVMVDGVANYFRWRLAEVSLCRTPANHTCLVESIFPENFEAQSLEIGGAGAMGKFLSFKQLEARLAAIESQPVMRFVGVWSADRQYNPGECVSDHGSVHHCNKSTRARPGTTTDWTLTCKRGADGKDAR